MITIAIPESTVYLLDRAANQLVQQVVLLVRKNSGRKLRSFMSQEQDVDEVLSNSNTREKKITRDLLNGGMGYFFTVLVFA